MAFACTFRFPAARGLAALPGFARTKTQVLRLTTPMIGNFFGLFLFRQLRQFPTILFGRHLGQPGTTFHGRREDGSGCRRNVDGMREERKRQTGQRWTRLREGCGRERTGWAELRQVRNCGLQGERVCGTVTTLRTRGWPRMVSTHRRNATITG